MLKPLRNSLRSFLAIVIAFICAVAQSAQPFPVHGDHAMAVSATAYASDTGRDIMLQGGNAIDAAAAMGFVLAVTYPQAGNIGGGGFMVVRKADGSTFALDFREAAPEAAHRDMYLDENGEIIGDMSLFTHAASGVPGSVDGLLRAWADHGSGEISRRELLRPAVRLARGGFPVSRSFAAELNFYADRFKDHEGSRDIFVRSDGESWREGDVFRQHDLARTLERIQQHGRDGFYHGPTAGYIVAEMARGNGLITQQDLARYRSKYRDAVRGTFMDHEILSMPPPSSGGILIVHMLNMLEHLNIADHKWGAASYIHLVTEVERRAYADRAIHLGDMDYWNVPMTGLASQEYAQSRAASIDMNRAADSETVSEGDPAPYESPDTTHYSVVDGAGNCVSVTTTLNLSYGSGIVVQRAGFLLNNEMDDFSAKPGEPNAYGLLGAEANAIQPGKRMLSSMSPTIVLKDGDPVLIAGSPGGSTIITTVMQIILNTIVHDMPVQDAVGAPRFHHQWKPNVVMAERFAIGPDAAAILTGMGHKIERRDSIGRAHCIAIDGDGRWGVPDPRDPTAAAAGF